MALRLESAKRGVGLMVGLSGTCVAIFTFSLFFLHPRFVSGEADPLFFKLAVGAIILSLFFFLYGGTFYYAVVEGFARGAGPASVYIAWADRLAVAAFGLFVLFPALALFAIRLSDLGSAALGLWFVHILVLVLTNRTRRGRD
jgi:uncharacterized membrane protein YhaH (DUF805 family)